MGLKNISESEAMSMLHVCDCDDDGNHTDPEVHEKHCSYVDYITREEKLRDE
jgi:hypothetical protein